MPLRREIGLWCEQVTGASAWATGKAALFLDRDGVILRPVPYLHKASDSVLVEGAVEVIQACNKNEIPVILVTNQSGIGRGMYGWQDFQEVQNELNSQLGKGGACLDLVLACAYHGEGNGEYRLSQHPWRKPQPGMIYEAARILQVDLSRSWIIGDRASDIEAGRASGLCGGILVLSGETTQSGAADVVGGPDFVVRKVHSIAACQFLIRQMSQSGSVSNI
ncbi:MAG: HAD family hydrolase [Pseudomonadota bacterium]|nr:HAD family hydrolase [Pseudomonadota bacterium]